MKNKIVEYLKQKYNAKIVILSGSRAGQNYTNTSDWDLFVFTEEDIDDWGPEKFDNQQLDIELIKLPIEEDFYLKTFVGPVEEAKVLLDEVGMANEIIETTKNKWEEGPPVLTARQLQNRKLKCERFISRIEKYDDEMVMFYFIGYFYDFSIRYWFEMRNIWPLPIYRAIPYIKEHDEEFYTHLQSLLAVDNSLVAAKSIYSKLFTGK